MEFLFIEFCVFFIFSFWKPRVQLFKLLVVVRYLCPTRISEVKEAQPPSFDFSFNFKFFFHFFQPIFPIFLSVRGFGCTFSFSRLQYFNYFVLLVLFRVFTSVYILHILICAFPFFLVQGPYPGSTLATLVDPGEDTRTKTTSSLLKKHKQEKKKTRQ